MTCCGEWAHSVCSTLAEWEGLSLRSTSDPGVLLSVALRCSQCGWVLIVLMLQIGKGAILFLISLPWGRKWRAHRLPWLSYKWKRHVWQGEP